MKKIWLVICFLVIAAACNEIKEEAKITESDAGEEAKVSEVLPENGKEKEVEESYQLPEVAVADVPLFSFRDQESRKYGFFNKEGEVVIEPQFAYAADFSEGLGLVAFVEGSGPAEHGFIDVNGELVIEPQFKRSKSFSNGYAAVLKGSEYGYINPQGEMVIILEHLSGFQLIGHDDFSDGVARLGYRKTKTESQQETEYFVAYINTNGEMVIPPIYETGTYFNEGLALVQDEQTEYYIDTEGNVVMEFDQEKFFRCPFQEGLACVTENGKRGFINRDGKMVIEPQFGRVESFSNGLASVKKGESWGYINNQGEYVIEPQYSHAQPFSEGLAWVEIEWKWGLIDRTNQLLIDPTFDNALSFHGGLALVTLDEESWFINRNGDFIFPFN